MTASPGRRLLLAQERSLSADQRLDRLQLYRQGHSGGLDVASAVISAEATFVINGASSLEVTLDDPRLDIENSGILGPDRRGRLADVRANLDGLLFRLAAINRDDHELQLTFEDAAVQLLRGPKKAMTASRGSMTRAQFIEKLVRDVPGNRNLRLVPFVSPEKLVKQPIAAPEIPNRRSDTTDAPPIAGDGGFDSKAKLTVKGRTADAEQKRNITIALQVADEENASPRARLALIVAGIGESSFRRKSEQPTTHALGVYQLIPATAASTGLDPKDTEATARYFLVHGYYRYGGAIKLAKDNPGMSVGEIVSKVEGSDAGGSFYQTYAAEARDIVEAWNPGAAHDTGGESVLTSKSYQFTRGLPDQVESSWDAALRLAEAVGWRFYVAAGVAVFVSDDRLLMNPASMDVSRGDDAITAYRWGVDHGKLARDVEITAFTNRWSVNPGSVVALRNFGFATGRWLVERAQENLLTGETTITLFKPHAAKLEPAHEVGETTGDGSSSSSSNDDTTGTRKSTATGLTYPLAKHGQKGGGPAEHATRAWGNWQSDNAVDILVEQGTNVYAVDDGEITKLGGAWRGGTGNPDGFNVTLKTSDNAWFYTHLKSRSDKLRVGKKIKAGEYLGESGAANGVNHLHIASEHDNPATMLGV